MSLTIIDKFTESLFLASNDRKLVLLVITNTIFYSSQDTSYPYKFCALIGWYVAILLKVSCERIKNRFYYWILLVVLYQVCLTYWIGDDTVFNFTPN
jgi:hypothetical protein